MLIQSFEIIEQHEFKFSLFEINPEVIYNLCSIYRFDKQYENIVLKVNFKHFL